MCYGPRSAMQLTSVGLSPASTSSPVPPAPPGRDYWITRSEAAKLLWETRRDQRARLYLPLYALVALYTGQRRRAILELIWKQVDLVRARIDFNPKGRVQTKKRRPIIPIPRSLRAALRRAHQRATCDFVMPTKAIRFLTSRRASTAPLRAPEYLTAPRIP